MEKTRWHLYQKSSRIRVTTRCSDVTTLVTLRRQFEFSACSMGGCDKGGPGGRMPEGFSKRCSRFPIPRGQGGWWTRGKQTTFSDLAVRLSSALSVVSDCGCCCYRRLTKPTVWVGARVVLPITCCSLTAICRRNPPAAGPRRESAFSHFQGEPAAEGLRNRRTHAHTNTCSCYLCQSFTEFGDLGFGGRNLPRLAGSLGTQKSDHSALYIADPARLFGRASPQLLIMW